MLQLVVNNTDTVEAVHVSPLTVSVHPDPCRFHYLSALRTSHGFERASKCRAAPGFDLDEGNQMPSPGHQIQLDAADPKAMRNDIPATTLEKADGKLFAGEAPLMTGIGPARWIAVNTARHALETIGRSRVHVIGKPLTGAKPRTGSGDPEYIEEERLVDGAT